MFPEHIVSSIYEKPAVKNAGNPYTNAVMVIDAAIEYGTLNSLLKEYEQKEGRDEGCRRAGRVPVDIDIVVWDGEVIREWDFRQEFFRIGLEMVSELPCPVVEEKADA